MLYRKTINKLIITSIWFCFILFGWLYFYDTSTFQTAILGCYRERWFILNSLSTYIFIWYCISLIKKINKASFFKIISVHLSLLFIITFLELCALFGIIDFRPLISRDGIGKVYGKNKPDSRLRYSGKPNSHIQGKVTQDLSRLFKIDADLIPFDIQTDKYGLRNPVNKDDAKVLLLGDSQLYAGYIPVEETVSQRLEQALNIPVMNISEPGYSPQEEYYRMISTRVNLSGKLVIHFIFEGNDLGDSEMWRDWMDRKFKFEYPQSGFLKSVLSWLHSGKSHAANERFGIFTTITGATVNTYFLFDGERITDQINEFNHLQSFFLQINSTIKSSGGQYAIVFLPMKIAVVHQFCKLPQNTYYRSPETWQSPLKNRLQQFCAVEKIPFKDLTVPLKQCASQGVLPFFPADTHLNSSGHQVIADFLFPWIKNLIEGEQDEL